MIYNFNLIRPLLTFESDDDFYYLQILQRKKENPELGNNSHVIKNYFIRSIDHLQKTEDEIIKLCDLFNARASIRLNKRSFKKCAFRSLEKITGQIMNEAYPEVRKFYSKVCGQFHDDPNKTWIIDVDHDTFNSTNDHLRLENVINVTRPEGQKVIAKIPSKTGYHLITSPFDVQMFRNVFPHLDIHKDSPTNLYIP